MVGGGPRNNVQKWNSPLRSHRLLNSKAQYQMWDTLYLVIAQGEQESPPKQYRLFSFFLITLQN